MDGPTLNYWVLFSFGGPFYCERNSTVSRELDGPK